ncbi:MAG: MMPL family transporter [Mycobacteriaceae bacterium]
MFAKWGNAVYNLRFSVIAALVAVLLGCGLYGLGLEKKLTQDGYFDPGSQSVTASILSDTVYGRDSKADVVVIYSAPEGKTVDDPEFSAEISNHLNQIQADNKELIQQVASYWSTPTPLLTEPTKKSAFVSIGLNGEGSDQVLKNYQKLAPQLPLTGVQTQIAGLQPIADAIGNGVASDTKRAELLAFPAVAVLLFLIFGGVIAASLPVIVGALTIAGGWAVMSIIADFTPVNTFASPVISLIGLGLAIDYGLFIVSRFREEIAEGYPARDAVRRTVMTAGRTVIYSATLIVASLACLLLFPQGFLRSVALAGITSVSIAALLSVTLLPAMLAVLGRNIDAFGFKFLKKTKSKEEVEKGFWGKLTNWVMRHPGKIAVPVILFLLLLIIPFGGIKFGGISEKYLPPANETRQAQEKFDELFPNNRTEPLKLVVVVEPEFNSGTAVSQVAKEANKIPGFTGKFAPQATKKNAQNNSVTVLSSGLKSRDTAAEAVDALRAIAEPEGTTILIGGTPALEQDSIAALGKHLPLMLILLVSTTTLLMFLAFGSLVLPIKAVLMSALGLGSTLGVLSWIFIYGNGSGVLDFTPGPLMSAVLVLIIAIIFGLSTDYEVFLVSRMVEARARGASTPEAIRVGTAQTGRIITAAALILVVVTGAFGFSELVLMKYIAYGMMTALILDATIIRMFLVPSIMKLLGDDCWWAPRWMKVVQQKIGLGEVELDDERHLIGAGGPAFAGVVIPEIDGRAIVRPPDSVEQAKLVSTMASRLPDTSAPVPPAPYIPIPALEPIPEPQVSEPTTAAIPLQQTKTHIPSQPRKPEETVDPRSIESWLGELRGAPGSIDGPGGRGFDTQGIEEIPEFLKARKTTDADFVPPAFNADVAVASLEPAQKRTPEDSATGIPEEPIDSEQDEGGRHRRSGEGGAISAQDLLRREGKL